jgi:hypothetical protein
MKYIHKYSVDGKSLYLLSDSPSKSSGTFTVKQGNWQGRTTSGRGVNVAKQLADLEFSKEDIPEEGTLEENTLEENTLEENTPSKKKACVTKIIRDFASTIQE